jgi:AraC family transcriptional regulator
MSGGSPRIEGPRIEVLDGMTVVGMRRAMSFAAPAMRELWQAFRPRVAEVGNRSSDRFISMRIHDDMMRSAPGPGTRFEQWAAVEVEGPGGVPDGMASHRLAGGRYAVFTYFGRADAFGAAARVIYGEWLPESAYELADREFFEVLGPSYRPDDPAASEAIWIPIQFRSGPPPPG